MKLYLLFILVFIHTVSNAFAYECIYAQKTTKEEPYSEIYPQGDCVEIIIGDILKIKKSHFNRLHFSEDKLAWVLISEPSPKKVFYVSSKGKIVRTHFYDNLYTIPL